MANRSTLGAGHLLAFILVTACDSTAPSDRLLLQVEGEILEAGQAPAPPLQVDIQAWPTLELGGRDSATLQTDAAGRYTAELGPFPNSLVDSLLVRVTQNDCGLQVTTELRRRDLTLGNGAALLLPTLAVSYRLPPAQVGVGATMCGAIVTLTTTEFIGDYARLALWLDEITDSLRGRWRLNHSASIGDDYGYFSGSLELDRLILQLRPTQPTPCTGLDLEIPVGGGNGSTLGVGSLAGDRSCAVPNTTLRFFEGAAMPEVLPPGGG